jgi:hypothetical protein
MPRVSPQQLELEVTRPESPPPPRRPGRDDSSRRPNGLPLRPDKGTGDPAREFQRPERKAGFPRLALTFAESAVMLGVSDEFFAQHVAGELRFVRRGRKKLVALRELERWLAESAARELH